MGLISHNYMRPQDLPGMVGHRHLGKVGFLVDFAACDPRRNHLVGGSAQPQPLEQAGAQLAGTPFAPGNSLLLRLAVIRVINLEGQPEVRPDSRLRLELGPRQLKVIGGGPGGFVPLNLRHKLWHRPHPARSTMCMRPCFRALLREGKGDGSVVRTNIYIILIRPRNARTRYIHPELDAVAVPDSPVGPTVDVLVITDNDLDQNRLIAGGDPSSSGRIICTADAKQGRPLRPGGVTDGDPRDRCIRGAIACCGRINRKPRSRIRQRQEAIQDRESTQEQTASHHGFDSPAKFLTMRAGLPAATQCGGTFLVTTE